MKGELASMRAYVEFAKKAFQNNMVYRVDYVIGVLNTVISIFVYVAVWKAIYGSRVEIEGISFNLVATNFILGLAISNLFNFDDTMISSKVIDGTIATDLLKPISFNGYMLFYNIGNVCFRTIIQFMPALILAIIFIGIVPPYSIILFLFFLFSVFLSFLLLYHLSYIVSILSFWFYNVWSISTIKGVLISLLSGTLMPMWFMPQGLVNFIKMTPFDSLFFIPISIYLGRINSSGLIWGIAKQIIWITILFIISQILWKAAVKRLVVEGG